MRIDGERQSPALSDDLQAIPSINEARTKTRRQTIRAMQHAPPSRNRAGQVCKWKCPYARGYLARFHTT